MARLTLDIVTPYGQLLSQPCDEVVSPGLLGQFGVLPEHIPFLVEVQPGVLWFRDGETRATYAVGPGFAEVKANKVVLLVESAERADQIDVERAKTSLVKFEAALAERLKDKPLDDPTAKLYQTKIRREQTRLEAATKPH